MGFWRKGLPIPRGKSTSHKTKRLILCLCILASVLPIVYFNYHTISYSLRPLWDTPPKPFQIIPHYYAEGTNISHLCDIHGWTPRATPRRVFDAVIFSNEIDVLEIRMRELMPLVTKFLVLESNATFTGQPKPLFFNDHRHKRFDFIPNEQLEHIILPSRPYVPNEDPFVNEHHQRHAMHRALSHAGLRDGDLLITADVDEIPSAHTIRLLQHCDGYPRFMHLQLRNYIYSFEFPVDFNSWRSSVQITSKDTAYSHIRQSDHLLAEAGWHCSFCFRYLADFAFKMRAYSHADRVRRPEFLNPERIQGVICRGSDIFDMLPEEFSFKELIGKLGDIGRSYSGVHLPRSLLEDAVRFRFLLPGNCTREPNPVDEPSAAVARPV